MNNYLNVIKVYWFVILFVFFIYSYSLNFSSLYTICSILNGRSWFHPPWKLIYKIKLSIDRDHYFKFNILNPTKTLLNLVIITSYPLFQIIYYVPWTKRTWYTVEPPLSHLSISAMKNGFYTELTVVFIDI